MSGDKEVIEIDEVACQLAGAGYMPPLDVEGVTYTYKGAALLKNGNVVVVFTPPPTSEDEG